MHPSNRQHPLMHQGRVYLWDLQPHGPLGGFLRVSVVPLERLDFRERAAAQLSGRHVRVRNGGWINTRPTAEGRVCPVPIGNAAPDVNGDFLFEPGRGGGRIDKVLVAAPDVLWRYVQAAHFGEVNAYYHVDRMILLSRTPNFTHCDESRADCRITGAICESGATSN